MPKTSTVRKKEYLLANPQAQRARTLRRMLIDLVFREDGKTWQRASGKPQLVPMPQWFLCLVGLSRETAQARAQLRAHLESHFQEGMTFENHGSCADGKWSIDHLEPCSSFTLGIKHFDEECRCFNYRNLRPIWSKENSSKGAR